MLKFILPFLTMINSMFLMAIRSEALNSTYTLYKTDTQNYFTVTFDYENYALIKSIQKEAHISSLECISFFAESFKSRLITYSFFNDTYFCKAYQYLPDFDVEVIPSKTFSNVFIRKGTNIFSLKKI